MNKKTFAVFCILLAIVGITVSLVLSLLGAPMWARIVISFSAGFFLGGPLGRLAKRTTR